jgi:hypothetical protein
VSFSLYAELCHGLGEHAEVDLVDRLLVEGGKHVRDLAGRRVHVWLQALRADLFIIHSGFSCFSFYIGTAVRLDLVRTATLTSRPRFSC